ncbi:MAG: response regulator [Myxococcales bacterium]
MAPACPAGSLEASTRGATILLVDDEDDVRGLVARMLEKAGYQVLTATGADQAGRLSRDRAAPIDLLLTDVIMPGRSGKSLWDEVKGARPATKVLFMSGYTDDVLGQHGAIGSDSPLLAKPFTAEALLARVREALGAADAAARP